MQRTRVQSCMGPTLIAGLVSIALGACSSDGSADATGDEGALGAGDIPAVTATCSASATVVPGETTRTITVAGRSRTFIVHVPPGYTGQSPVALVMDFHPLGGSGRQQKGLSGWGAVADAKNFIVVWPNGVGNSWNVGRCCGSA